MSFYYYHFIQKYDAKLSWVYLTTFYMHTLVTGLIVSLLKFLR